MDGAEAKDLLGVVGERRQNMKKGRKSRTLLASLSWRFKRLLLAGLLLLRLQIIAFIPQSASYFLHRPMNVLIYKVSESCCASQGVFGARTTFTLKTLIRGKDQKMISQ